MDPELKKQAADMWERLVRDGVSENDATQRVDAWLAEQQPPVRQPGMTGIAAFGADPNYLNALSRATRGVVGEVAQGATANYADEFGVPRQEGVPGPVSFAAQTAGAAIPAFLGGGTVGKMLTSFPSRLMGGGILGAGAASAYASGAAPSGERGSAAIDAAPLGYLLGVTAPALTSAVGKGYQLGRRLFGFPENTPVGSLAEGLGESAAYTTSVNRNRALADQLAVEGAGVSDQGRAAVRTIGAGLSADDARDVARTTLASRRRAEMDALGQAVDDIVAPGTTADARRQIAQEAYQVHQNAEAPAAAQEIVRRIRDNGGTTIVTNNRIGTSSEPLRNVEVQHIIKAAENSPSARIRQFADELRQVQEFALREGHGQYARAMRAEALDRILRRAEVRSDLVRRALPAALPDNLVNDIRRILNEDEFRAFMSAYERISRDATRTVALSDALDQAYGAAFQTSDMAAQELTLGGYVAAGQPGAAARTGITAGLRKVGLPAQQASSREQLRLLLEEDPLVSVRALREYWRRQRALPVERGQRAGILSSYVGSRTGSLLGGG